MKATLDERALFTTIQMIKEAQEISKDYFSLGYISDQSMAKGDPLLELLTFFHMYWGWTEWRIAKRRNFHDKLDFYLNEWLDNTFSDDEEEKQYAKERFRNLKIERYPEYAACTTSEEVDWIKLSVAFLKNVTGSRIDDTAKLVKLWLKVKPYLDIIGPLPEGFFKN